MLIKNRFLDGRWPPTVLAALIWLDWIGLTMVFNEALQRALAWKTIKNSLMTGFFLKAPFLFILFILVFMICQVKKITSFNVKIINKYNNSIFMDAPCFAQGCFSLCHGHILIGELSST
jgi:hypothetical protein